MKYELIIFDCDGTLVDSEPIYAGVFADLMTEHGIDGYTAENTQEEFQGLTFSESKKRVETRHDAHLPEDLNKEYVARANKLVSSGLKPVDGAIETLTALQTDYKICVGSNGERNNVLHSLETAGMSIFFPEAYVFTKIQVARGKPAPDLFLYAADQMGINPANTVVIEDSPTGVQAAVAAGMTCWGFTGTAHDPQSHGLYLKQTGAHQVIQEFIHIRDLLSI